MVPEYEDITVRSLRKWLDRLPEEMDDAIIGVYPGALYHATEETGEPNGPTCLAPLDPNGPPDYGVEHTFYLCAIADPMPGGPGGFCVAMYSVQKEQGPQLTLLQGGAPGGGPAE